MGNTLKTIKKNNIMSRFKLFMQAMMASMLGTQANASKQESSKAMRLSGDYGNSNYFHDKRPKQRQKRKRARQTNPRVK